MDDFPHQFVKDGKEYQITKDRVARPLICIHCGKRYVAGLENCPNDPCPARNIKSEKKRLLNE